MGIEAPRSGRRIDSMRDVEALRRGNVCPGRERVNGACVNYPRGSSAGRRCVSAISSATAAAVTGTP